MAPSSNGALLSLRILLLCALAAAVVTTLLPLVTRPCAYSVPRTILAATGVLSCSGDASDTAALSEDAGAGEKARRSHRPAACGDPDLPPHALPPFRCCPPTPASAPANFTFPDAGEPLRTRRPVHEAGAAHMAKFARAVALMKALPRDDPRSFHQQASIHCAYCAGALFFPFHRAYLYFFERIAARLLGDDPAFAVPFWSWDVPEGMRVPAEFADAASPLFDPMRNSRHAPPAVVDLDFLDAEKNLTVEQQIQHNLRIMYKQMISNAPLPSLFQGQPYRAGDAEKPGAGTVEVYPHNTMHGWTGDVSPPNHEDMGVYYSAGRDPIFYPHHANIDRLWEAWRGSAAAARGRRRRADFADHDWLDSSFLFYDEDARLVRVTVRDMLDVGRLRYRYAGVGLPWLRARPPATPGVNGGRGKLKSVTFPVSLDAAVSVEVRRPAALRSRRQKAAREEVLVVEGVEADGAGFVKFDVYVNAVEYEKVGPGGREMAGSFVSLKHPGGEEAEAARTSMRVALNELLEDLGADGDESVTVTLVPVRGKVRIGGLRIVYMAE
ncbi:hypothetical protein ACP4OV_019528 [Aristida adscensionis]